MLTGEKLSFLRKKEGWSQGELADKLNISRQSVSKWELNESLPDAENIVKISNLFNVSTDYLLKDNAELTQQTEETPKKKFYTVQGIITTLTGILILGTINVLGHIFCSHVLDSFTTFAYSYGLEWLVYLSAAVTIIGLSVLIRDLYIKKSKKYQKLQARPLKLFVFFTIFAIIVIYIFILYSFGL